MGSPLAQFGERSNAGRVGERHRVTRETDVTVRVHLDEVSPPSISTGLPFFDHMLAQLGKHGSLGLEISATGDLEVDAHHTVEDVGITLGEALGAALGDKTGIVRFASVSLPLDEALVDVALDCSGRPFLRYEIGFEHGYGALGNPPFEPHLAEDFWRATAHAAALTLHISLRYGRDPHHILEACFKAVGRALRAAAVVEGGGVPSTKGAL